MFHFAVIGIVAAAVNTFGPVLYGSPVPGEKHALDVYAPAGAQALPVIVFFHGGGLQEGDRRDYVRFGKELAGQGYAVVIPSYRLYPSVRVRGSVSDAASALAWTARHISHYGGSAQKIVLLGHSAGGYLAAVLVLDARNLLAVRLASTIVRGVFELSADYSNRDPDPAEPPKPSP